LQLLDYCLLIKPSVFGEYEQEMCVNMAGTGGRPVNAKAGADLKVAALRLIREKGYENVSIAAIATEAGVARQTLYNRWNTKADLVLEAVFEATRSYAADPVRDAAKTCRQLLEEFLTNVFAHLNVDGDILRALIAAAQQDATFQNALYTRFVQPREQMITTLLSEARDRAELSPDCDPEMVSTFIHGAFWYRLLNRKALDAKLAKDITSEVFNRPFRSASS
jgi:AcrR family transcriptional regulator